MHFTERASPAGLLREEDGASLTEYVLLAALFAVFCTIVWIALGKST